MAGGRLEVSRDFGPAWAHLVFGADGIVYLRSVPLRGRGLRVDLGGRHDRRLDRRDHDLDLDRRAHPASKGRSSTAIATFSVGPVDLTVEFGDQRSAAAAAAAVGRLRPQVPRGSRARASRASLTAIPGKGALPPGTGPGGATDTGTADGSAEKPFTVFAEFEIMVTSTVPTRTHQSRRGARSRSRRRSTLGLAPMKIADAATDAARSNLIGDATAAITRPDCRASCITRRRSRSASGASRRRTTIERCRRAT